MNLIWHEGVELQTLLAKLEKLLGQQDLHLDRSPSSGQYWVYFKSEGGEMAWKQYPSYDIPDPVGSMWRMSWSFLNSNGERWFNFSFRRGGSDGDAFECVSQGKIIQLFLGICDDFDPWPIYCNPEKLPRVITKYQQAKHLFKALNCDEVVEYSDTYDTGVYWGDPDPDHEGKILRFAKEGRQVLIRPYEEFRGMEENEYLWRVVVDPEE